MLAFAYVCVVSEFLLPTLEACLSVRPRLVVMITSSHTVFEAAAKRLQVQLEEAGMAVKVLSEHSTGERLDGDDIEANAVWLRRHLVPLLQQWQHEGLHCVANLTGGTKAMALALFTCHPWHRLDYLPFGQPCKPCANSLARPTRFCPLPHWRHPPCSRPARCRWRDCTMPAPGS